jgi:hypothetical protein
VKQAAAFLATLLLALPLWAQSVGLQDSLWQKAVALSGTSEDWVPGSIVVRVERLDGKGNVQSTEETWMRMSLGPDGKLKQEVVKRVKDGREQGGLEVRAEARSGQGEKKGQGKGVAISVSGDEDPFTPSVQGGVSAKRTALTQRVLGKPCVGYDYTLAAKEGKAEKTLRGTAWLEEGTGAPVEIRFSPTPLPKHVQRLVTTVRYETTPEGTCLAREMVMEGSGGFLFIKKAYRGTIRFSDYWKRPPGAKP